MVDGEQVKNDIEARETKTVHYADQHDDDSMDDRDQVRKGSPCLPDINVTLIYCKLFYLFFNAAMGSLWPYLPLYFRQLFLTPRQVGTIVACRTFVQFLCVPFWIGVAEKYKKHKPLLISAILFWLLSTIAIMLVPEEEPRACLRMETDPGKMSNAGPGSDSWFDFATIHKTDAWLLDRGIRENIINASRETSSKLSVYDPNRHVSDSSQVFILILLCTITGVCMASPAQVLADICTIKLLRQQEQTFGKQVLWGAVGFGVCAFLVGSAVSFSKHRNPCTKEIGIDYHPCFYVFAFFMALTLFVSSQFKFSEEETRKVDLDETVGSFWEGLKTIHDVHLASLLVVTFYCGIGHGFISTFLLWHLREMGGLQILLALVSLINGIAELMFYILSDQLMSSLGYFRIIYLGLFCFSLRFFYYSILRQPWLVLPIEITHGMTSAAIRSSIIAYIRQEGETGNILHGVFNGIHVGLGFSIGGLVGGLMVHEYGHSITFLIFGEISLIVMFCFILVNSFFPYTKYEYEALRRDRGELLSRFRLQLTGNFRSKDVGSLKTGRLIERRNSVGGHSPYLDHTRTVDSRLTLTAD